MSENKTSGKEKREYFRLKYQVSDRASVEIEGKETYEIIDISEHGIRFLYTGGVVENPIKAKLSFKSGLELDIKATIRRINENEICIHIPVGIPLRILMDEQRELYKKYGKVMEGDAY